MNPPPRRPWRAFASLLATCLTIVALGWTVTRGAPQDTTPQEGAPQDTAPQDGAPEDSAAADTSPREDLRSARKTIRSAATSGQSDKVGDERPVFQDAPDPCADWQKPQAVLFLTGRQHGYIEPCGCTGLDQAKGGLSRRATLKRQLNDRGWDILPLDVGDQVRRFGAQAAIKFQTTADVLRKMDYRAVGFGPDDLRLSVDELAAALAGDGQRQGPFLCANVRVLDMNPSYCIVRAGGMRIGITAVLGNQARREINNLDIEIFDPIISLQAVVKKLKQAKCDRKVLLAQASLEESRALARAIPVFDIVVTAGGAGEPTLEPERIAHTPSQMIQVGTKGMYVGVLGFFDDGQQPVRYERVPLDARFPDAPDVMDAFGLYQLQLKDMGLAQLGVKPVRHPSGHEFVGHEACGECHTSAYAVFEETTHFHATESIAKPSERSDIPRHFDPECLSCHVTGWHPQKFFPYVSGYLDYDKSELLHSNGCENCHGPGSAHVAAENGDVEVSDEEIEKLRKEMRLTIEEARNSACIDTCHDLDNSPDFEFDSYWEEVKHEGVD